MDINPPDAAEPSDAPECASRSRQNPAVAITVALLATLTGICKVKGDNIVQAVQQAQAEQEGGTAQRGVGRSAELRRPELPRWANAKLTKATYNKVIVVLLYCVAAAPMRIAAGKRRLPQTERRQDTVQLGQNSISVPRLFGISDDK